MWLVGLSIHNDRAPPPSCVSSRLPDVTHVTLSPSPPPPHSVFAYCKRSKTGDENALGERGYILTYEQSMNQISCFQACPKLCCKMLKSNNSWRCELTYIDVLRHEQSTNHVSLKKGRPRCYTKPPTAQDTFLPIPSPHQLHCMWS